MAGVRNTGGALAVAVFGAGICFSQLQAVAGANSDLGTSFVDFFEDADGSVNSLFSSYSIETCFSLVYPGAAGVTKSQIASSLGFDTALSGEELFDEYQALETTLETAYNGTVLEYGGQAPNFKSANKIFVDDNFQLKTEYAAIVADLVQVLDLASGTAEDTINEWCEEATNGLIKHVVNDVSEMELVAVNAIYLNATWSSKFNPDNTHLGTFYSGKGNAATVVSTQTAFMHQLEDLQHAVVEDHDVVILPYQSGQLSMVVAVPRSANPSALDGSAIHAALQTNSGLFSTKSVGLALPKFTYEGSYAMNSALSDLGIVQAFDPVHADFSGMSDTEVFISSVIHKTYINVWEEGTEAAAVTAILLETTSFQEPTIDAIVLANVPFTFFIYDRGTDRFLFTGRVFNPETDDTPPAATGDPHSCGFWTEKFNVPADNCNVNSVSRQSLAIISAVGAVAANMLWNGF